MTKIMIIRHKNIKEYNQNDDDLINYPFKMYY